MKPNFRTWLDVDRYLRKITKNYSVLPAQITGIDCYADAAEVRIGSEGDIQPAKNWIKENFENVVNDDIDAFILEIGEAEYVIDFVANCQALENQNAYPLWSELAFFESSVNYVKPKNFAKKPKVVAFHSFKGGVGRTTALITYVSAILNSDLTSKVLVVDADLEAPGITWWLDSSNKPSVSFVGFMEALHYPPMDTETSLTFFADELKKSSININGKNELFILPSAHSAEELMHATVLPEHIARNQENPWLLSDYIYKLGEKLEANYIFIDLRAGLSELSSPFLFDRRIDRFLVTTVAHQSITGMEVILSKIAAMQLSDGQDDQNIAPTLIISLLTDLLRKSDDFANAIERLNSAYPIINEDSISPNLPFLEVGFDADLMSLTNLKSVLETVKKGSLYPLASDWAADYSASLNSLFETPKPAAQLTSRDDEFRRLLDTCQKFQFAEKGEADAMLVTEPLRNLGKHYSKELPNVISIGAKGSGKTFNMLQLCQQKVWGTFLTKVGASISNADTDSACIFPVLISRNLEKQASEMILGARENCWSEFGINGKQFSDADLRTTIDKALAEDTTWLDFWQKIILQSFGLEGDSIESLNDFLNTKNKKLILLFDGIEDIFMNPETESHKKAINGIFDLCNRISEFRSSNIGIVSFVRADYVRSVISQNAAQFENRYAPFRLEWTPEAFLRLVYWISASADVIDAERGEAELLSLSQLLEKLDKLWGKKLGINSSKEAYSARWIFAALCDLKGRLQARDVIRFLKICATQMLSSKFSVRQERLLAPEAIRKSLPLCSREKVEEAQEEMLGLKQWIADLALIASDDKRIPFDPRTLQMTPTLIDSLESLGVIYEDRELNSSARYYIPEIYRFGLGFQVTGGARPKVLALLQRNLGGIPF